MASRDLSRLRTSHAIMYCGKVLAVNACTGAEIRLLCIFRPKASHHLAHRFEVTIPCEHNKNQTMQSTTEALHDLTTSTAATPSN